MDKNKRDKDREEDPIDELFDNITRIFSSIFGIPLNQAPSRHIVNKEENEKEEIIKHVREMGDNIIVIYDVPGVDPSTIILKVKDNKLYLYARNNREIRDVTELKTLVKDKIKSWDYRNGILEVVLEKKKGWFK